MSALPFSERLRADYEALAPELPPAVVPPELRRQAVERLSALGLPGLRDDEHRYANLRPLQDTRLAPEVGGAPGALTQPLPAPLPGALRLVYVDGRLAPEHSDDPSRNGAFGALGGSATERGTDERFALLNDAFALDAAQFTVRGAAALDVVWMTTRGGPASYPRLRLQLAPGAELQLVERHLGAGSLAAPVAPVVELELGRESRCTHTRFQDLATEALVLDTLRARLQANAEYDLVHLQLGGGAVRSTFACELAGRAARTRLAVVSLADASRTLDGALRVQHQAPETTSQQELRAIATGRAHIAFQSCAAVLRGAPGADSRQSLRGLIGGETAEVNLRPQLEIDIDQVSASHGATTGTLDEAMLFYLLSRGLDRETARLLLEWAFVEAVLGRIALPSLRREAEERTVARLGNRAARELLQ